MCVDSLHTQLETGGHMNAFLSGLFVAPDTSTRLFETNAGFAYPADSTTVFFRYAMLCAFWMGGFQS